VISPFRAGRQPLSPDCALVDLRRKSKSRVQVGVKYKVVCLYLKCEGLRGSTARGFGCSLLPISASGARPYSVLIHAKTTLLYN